MNITPKQIHISLHYAFRSSAPNSWLHITKAKTITISSWSLEPITVPLVLWLAGIRPLLLIGWNCVWSSPLSLSLIYRSKAEYKQYIRKNFLKLNFRSSSYWLQCIGIFVFSFFLSCNALFKIFLNIFSFTLVSFFCFGPCNCTT